MANRSQSRSTTDHDEIRQCAEARGGRPAVVKSTRGNGMIPEFCGSIFLATAPVRWRKSRGKNSSKNWIEKNSLWSIRTPPPGGRKSNFNKIVSCETVTGAARSRSGAGKSGGRAISETGRKRTRTATKKRRAKQRAQARGA